MSETGFFKRFAWFVFGIVPAILLVLCVALAAIGTIVLDHDVLGRDAQGWPVLYKTPALRHAVALFHLAIVYVLPPFLAVSFFLLGRKVGAALAWVLLGGVIVCALGSIHLIEAVWTGVRGTSELRLGLADGPTIAARLGANLATYAGAIVYLRR